MEATDKRGNLVVGQAGGPTAVINRSVVGVIREALKNEPIDRIYGMRNGLKGFLEEDLIDLRELSDEDLERIAKAPGAALGSCRLNPKERDCEQVFEICKKHNIRYFIYVGGNDSALAASFVNRIARDRGYELRVFHVPKTVDNDLLVTDHCPGFGSAGRYVAMAFIGSDLDTRSLPGIKIDIVMGRQAGWLTTTAALGAESKADGPHLLYFPEHPKSLTTLCNDIEAVYRRHGRAVVAVSEGLRGPDESLLLQSEAIRKEASELFGSVFVEWLDKFGAVMERAGGARTDAFGHVQLSGTGILGDFIAMVVKAALNPKLGGNLRVRADTLGYVQRSFAGCLSESDAREALEVGQEAVRYAMRGDIDGSVVINRLGDGENYMVEYRLARLEEVAAGTKDVPREFVNARGNGITDDCRRYLAPLVGPLPKRAKIPRGKPPAG